MTDDRTPEDREQRMYGLFDEAVMQRRLLEQMKRQAERDAEEQRLTRYTLLRVHAWMGMIVGLTMMFTGTAQVFEQQIGTWTRPVLGGLAMLGGVVLLTGTDSRGGSRRHLAEVLGLGLMTLWDLAMAMGFVITIYQYGSIVFRMPWDLGVIDPAQARPYGPFVYFGIGSMIALVHLPACWRDLRNRRG